MPARHGDDVPVNDDSCRRCRNSKAVVVSRGHALCARCFCKYVSTKIVKRMEVSFRVRDSSPGSQPRLLLPFSMGHCSNALLSVLSQHLQGQARKSGRTGYQLHVLHVNDAESDFERIWDQVKLRYPDHIYSSCSLDVDDSVLASLNTDRSRLQSSLSSSGAGGSQAQDQMALLMDILPSATSRDDVAQLLRHRQIVRFAKDHGCEAILWGHSTTHLAELTLAETAKGRGFALPWLVADGESPLGVPSHFPLRELLTKEAVALASYADPPFEDIVLKRAVRPTVSTKNATIDALMRQYFTTVETEYPSIVANVVRTTSKLQVPALDHFERHCELCEMPLLGQAPEKSRLCYACIRNLPISPT